MLKKLELPRYNVLCVTVRGKDDKECFFHLPPYTDVAVLEADSLIRYGVKTYRVKETRSGLNGQALVIRLVDGEGILELYTDTPDEDSRATPEELRESARKTMSLANGWTREPGRAWWERSK